MSNLDRNIPLVTSLEVSLFEFVFGSWFWCLLVVGLAWSAALRSPKGGAFSANRKAKPTTAVPVPLLLLATLSAALHDVPLRAMGDCVLANTCVSSTRRVVPR